MLRRLLLVAGLVQVAVPAAASPQLDNENDPFPGIHQQEWSDPAIPAAMHVARIDLSSSELTVFATAEADRGATVSAYAGAHGGSVAVNGDAFAPNGYLPLGLAMGDGSVWSTTSDSAEEGFVDFARVGERTSAAISVPSDVVATSDLPAGTQGVVSGRPLLVRAGQAIASYDCTDAVAIPCERAPRTAVALSGDGNTMWLVVVDGWQSGSIGMTAAELASFLDTKLGAATALALDGGSSSTMVVDGALASSPSDGAERVVANHLAVHYGQLPPGELVGFIRDGDVFSGPDISGALVQLDDGRSVTTGSTGFYDFAGVSPRLACVTVTASGYCTQTQCKQVLGQMTNYNSFAMVPDTDCPAAAPDAAVPDAAILSDAGGGGDGGTGANGDGGGGHAGGCCGVGGSGGWGSALILCALVGWYRRRT